MKTNILAFWRKNNRDMFRLTQFRLTALYSGMLMVFLTLFIVIVYSIFYVMITNDQERRINTLADQERKAMEDILAKQTILDFLDEQNVLFLSEDQFFFYVVNPRGQLVMGDEVNKAVR
ncbi:MAG: histidine kinase, partial [Anoxybacillus sp.]|nr:histidine kinase [Anoxybacillus sp.]